MLEKFKANILFKQLLKRPNIDKAYAMVKPTDSWYDTITKVHNSLAEIHRLPHEILEITSHDNLRLKGIYYPSAGKGGVTVICIHGYTSHAEREWAFPGLFYHALGYNVLIPYQRAHGLSEGKYLTFSPLECRDMMRWAKKINEITPDDRIIFHGLSMGGGIALDLCDREMHNVAGIISDAPSHSLRAFFEGVAGHIFKQEGKKIAAHAIARYEKEFGVKVDDYECADHVSRSRYPILLSAGSMENLEKEFEEYKNRNPQPTDIIILPGCNHGNGMYKQTDLYQQTIKDFITGIL